MDYGQYKQIEFRRKFWKFFGVDIKIFDPHSNTEIGFINQRTIQIKPDVYVYTDETKQTTVVNLRKQTVMRAKPKYSILDPSSQTEIGTMQFSDFKSYFARWHINIYDQSGADFGYVQETSSFLAVLRRWMGLINEWAELILAFVPQTFDIYHAPGGAEPKLVGQIVHRKNPLIVKLGLDLTNGVTSIDPKINLAICTLLCLRDISKNA